MVAKEWARSHWDCDWNGTGMGMGLGIGMGMYFLLGKALQ
jgi:hypothetical protein